MALESTTQPAKKGLAKERKIGFVLLLIFAIMTVGLGVLQIRNNLLAPFALNSQVPSTLKSAVNNIDALRYRDTDHDGLSDYDELYLYGTSPYLYDTFSYGLSDKEVIDKGLPLCPKGQDCTGTGGAWAEANSTATTSLFIAAEEPGAAPPDILAALQDPAKLRELLLNSGVDQSVLNRVSDADLINLVNQTVITTSSLSNLQATSQSVGAGFDLSQAVQDPAVLRQALLKSGVKKADLDKISDVDLVNSAKQIIQNSSSTQDSFELLKNILK